MDPQELVCFVSAVAVPVRVLPFAFMKTLTWVLIFKNKQANLLAFKLFSKIIRNPF